MASRMFYEALFSLTPDLTYMQGQFVVGSTGAVGTTKGNFTFTRVSQGVYKATCTDPFNRLMSAEIDLRSGPGTPVAIDASDALLTVGHAYVITALGTSTTADWHAVGVPSDITPAVGVTFVATATGHGTGNGTAAPPLSSGITACEIFADPNFTINESDNYFIFQTYGATDSSTTTLIPKDPAEGSVLVLSAMYRNSSLKGKGE